MTTNSEWFAQYLRGTREHFELSQQAVAAAGGPHRQLQAAIENGDEPEISSNVMSMFDRAHRWPVGYTQALAELGEYLLTGELSDTLLGGERDQEAYTDRYGDRGMRPRVRKTLSALYDSGSGLGLSTGAAPLGFDPESGAVSYLEGPLLTNIGLEQLLPMMLARDGVTTIDVGLLSGDSERAIREYVSGYMMQGAGQNQIPVCRVGVDEPSYATSMILDPISEITSLAEAKRFAADLLRLRPEVATTAVRAGYTLLAIAAFGEDPLVTLTQLKRRGGDDSGRQFAARFAAFWETFYDPAEAGPDLAHPDTSVCDLLAGVLAGRDECLQVQISPAVGQPSRPRYERRHAVKAGESLSDEKLPLVMFYDGNIVPELPIVQSRMWPTRALTFYAAQLSASADPHGATGGEVRPQFGGSPYFRIGITAADDRDVVAHHDRYTLGTLTNYVAGQAIYSDSGRARRVWIPDR
ncbi:hypothetical protein FIV07_27990 (plasmid) [Mycobacterium sp. THAF192]|nr:hypothetical protein FIV07_27990 [Mycobacterium sp. THAF192]